jgi:acyl-CoA thioester hydrolase
MQQQHEINIRVRYSETDAMGFLHHSNYLNYFEMGRTELFRAQGGNYRKMEEQGLYFVIVQVDCKYRIPAKYDDVLTLKTSISNLSAAKLEHEYQLYRADELVATARTVLACIDRAGTVQKIPEILPEKEGL